MTTKPATPFPDVFRNAIGQEDQRKIEAYPRLVEALRQVTLIHCRQDGSFQDRIDAIPNARALLRELGEL